MSNISRDTVANVVGKGASVLFTLAFVPFYFRLLGTEGYGLIGFFVMLQTVLLLADGGFGGALTRELAWLSSERGAERRISDICRTFELLVLGIGCCVAALVASASGFIAQHWVNAEHLSSEQVRNAIVFMGIAIGLQLPFAIYQGALIGLQHHVVLNTILVAVGLTRGVGAVVLLMFYDHSPTTFFAWQALVSIAQLLAAHIVLWQHLPKSDSAARVDLGVLRTLWRFAAGLAAIGVTSSILTQVDKLVLSQMLPLAAFGYYSLATVVAGLPLLLAAPFHSAVYPRFASLVSAQNTSELTKLYHTACQFLAVVMLPIGGVVIFFSKELILLWTGDPVTATNSFLIASVLAVGSTLLGLMYIPYALQLAFGWTTLPLVVNLVAIAFLVPLTVWLAAAYGALGAATVWVLLNLIYVVGTIQWMHRRLLRAEKLNWYLDAVARPLGATLAPLTASWAVLPDSMSPVGVIAFVGVTLVIAIASAAFSAPLVRSELLSRLSRAAQARYAAQPHVEGRKGGDGTTDTVHRNADSESVSIRRVGYSEHPRH